MIPRLSVQRVKIEFQKKKFEDDLTDFFSRKTLLCPSGRVGLEVALRSHGIKRSDRVILPSFNAASVVNTVGKFGKPIFAEIDEKTLNIDPEKIPAKKGDFLIVLHSEGNPCPMRELMEIAEDKELVLIEDCAHSIGSSIHGKKTGTFGDSGIISFGPGKMINALKGGAVFFEEKEIIGKASHILDKYPKKSFFEFFLEYVKNNLIHLLSQPLLFDFFVYPFLLRKDLLSKIFIDKGKRKIKNMHEFQTSMGVQQLNYLEKKIRKRTKTAREIIKNFPKNLFQKHLGAPNFHSLCFFSQDNEDFRKKMIKHGVDVQKTWLRGYTKKAKKMEKSIAYLPIHENVDEKGIEKIVRGIKDYQNSIN